MDYFEIAILLSLLLYLLAFIIYLFRKISTNNSIKNYIFRWAIQTSIFIMGSIVGSLIVSFFSPNTSYFAFLFLYPIFLFSSFFVYSFSNRPRKSFSSMYYNIQKNKRKNHKKSEIIDCLQDNLKRSKEEILLQNLTLTVK